MVPEIWSLKWVSVLKSSLGVWIGRAVVQVEMMEAWTEY